MNLDLDQLEEEVQQAIKESGGYILKPHDVLGIINKIRFKDEIIIRSTKTLNTAVATLREFDQELANTREKLDKAKEIINGLLEELEDFDWNARVRIQNAVKWLEEN